MVGSTNGGGSCTAMLAGKEPVEETETPCGRVGGKPGDGTTDSISEGVAEGGAPATAATEEAAIEGAAAEGAATEGAATDAAEGGAISGKENWIEFALESVPPAPEPPAPAPAV